MQIEKMKQEEKVGAVIVAAGMSSRMGDFKPMLQMGSISIVKRIIANFQQAGVFPIVLVTGFRAEELEKHISKFGVICVRNENYQSTEMSASANIGLSYLEDKCDRVFFSPVDIPLFTVDTVRRLMQSRAKIAKPVCKGEQGHPVLISCSILPELLAWGQKENLREAMKRFSDETELVDVEDEGILKDADTPEDYHEMVEYHSRQMLRPSIEISLMQEDKIFDKNGAMLLYMIDYDGTVKGACEKMQISYSKAWNMLSAFEANLGFPLVERCPGGEYGGESRLTEKGRSLLLRYERFSEQVRRFAGKCFRECFYEEEQDGAGES